MEPKNFKDHFLFKNRVDHDDMINELHRWMSTFSHYVDSQDSFVVEEVNNLHNKMIHWMVQALIRLAPDKEDLSEEAKKMIYDSTSTVEALEKMSTALTEKIEKFTTNLCKRCTVIITDDENNRKPNEESKFDKEMLNIQNFQNEYKEWNYALKLVINDLTGDRTHRKSITSDKLGYHHSSVAESKEKTNLEVLNEDESEEDEEEQEEEDEDQSRQGSQSEQYEYQPHESDENKEEKDPKNGVSFEIINKDTNTEYKFLENLTLEDSNHLTEEELKSTVFNAFKTIESLQNDLM